MFIEQQIGASSSGSAPGFTDDLETLAPVAAIVTVTCVAGAAVEYGLMTTSL